MNWTVTIHSPKYTDYDGFVHEEETRTFECPFECRQDVYYVFLEERIFRKDRWVARKSKVIGVWATNTFGVELDNNEHIPKNWFNRLFSSREAAIEFCLRKNQQLKVKVYD